MGLSAGVRPRYGPIFSPVPATDRSDLSWITPEVMSQDQRARKVWVSRGITPDLKTSPG